MQQNPVVGVVPNQRHGRDSSPLLDRHGNQEFRSSLSFCSNSVRLISPRLNHNCSVLMAESQSSNNRDHNFIHFVAQN